MQLRVVGLGELKESKEPIIVSGVLLATCNIGAVILHLHYVFDDDDAVTQMIATKRSPSLDV